MLRFRGDGESHVSRALCARGLKAFYHPKASVYHFVSKERMTLDYFYKRSYAEGISDSYAEIRAAHLEEEGAPPRNTPGNLPARLKKIVKDTLLRLGAGPEIERVTKRGYGEGYSFHQREVRKDPALLQWVLRENYFDV
jgi:hypothetical protein